MNCTECQDLFCKHRSQSTAGGQCFYESKEQMEKLLAVTTEATLDYVDWSAFRRKAAKDILCSMVRGGYDWGRGAEQARLAVSYAEELIKALKEEKA